ncbi:MAG: PEP-CTERM sorting domain-containing protein [Crocosphaera sp.]|nr:PEP-CTERM sorting domain-containing protein [Crocosphaera sp.]
MNKLFSPLTAVFIGTSIPILGSMPSASAYDLYTDYTQWQGAMTGLSISTETFSYDRSSWANRVQTNGFVDSDGNQSSIVVFPDTGIVSTGYAGTTTNYNTVTYSPFALDQMGSELTDGYVFRGGVENPNTKNSNHTDDWYDQIVWTFPEAVRGFFGTFFELANPPESLITLKNGTEEIVTINITEDICPIFYPSDRESRPCGIAFSDIVEFGIMTDQPFTSIYFSQDGNNYPYNSWSVDNLSFATATAVPEPLTILGAGTAIAFGATFKRKYSSRTSKK